MKANRKWDIAQEKRTAYITALIDFFKTERNEDIGIVAAGNILDHFLQDVGVQLYNKGVEDSAAFMKERLESLELDMEAMLKR